MVVLKILAVVLNRTRIYSVYACLATFNTLHFILMCYLRLTWSSVDFSQGGNFL